MATILSSSFFSYPKSLEEENQDTLLIPKKTDNGFILGIADGVGGYAGGKKASSFVVDYLYELNIEKYDVTDIFDELKSKISNLSINDKSLSFAATTFTFCVVNSQGVTIGHCGDCRVYFKVKNKLKQITKDHTQHQILIDKGLYTARQLRKLQGGNVLTTAISEKLNLEYQVIKISLDELPLEDGVLNIFIMSDGAHHFWEERPRFSENTLSSPAKFSASLQRRIESKGAHDDYSLIGLCAHF
jgi:protein phosphatase